MKLENGVVSMPGHQLTLPLLPTTVKMKRPGFKRTWTGSHDALGKYMVLIG